MTRTENRASRRVGAHGLQVNDETEGALTQPGKLLSFGYASGRVQEPA